MMFSCRSIMALLLLAVTLSSGWSAPLADFPQKTHVVKKLQLLTEPTKLGEPIATVQPGLEVDVLNYNTSGRWIKVRTPGGREGWLPTAATALAGRRDKPLISQGKDSPVDGSDLVGPSSGDTSETSGTKAKTKNGQPITASSFLNVGLAYLNQINLAHTSGGGAQLTYEFPLGASLYAGPAIFTSYFYETATVGDFKTTRNDFKIQPGVSLSFRPIVGQSGFSTQIHVALDVDHTSLHSVNRVTHEVITSAGGLQASGSDSSFGIAAGVRPGFQFATSNTGSLNLFLVYELSFALRTAQQKYFATGGSERVLHTAGLGLSYLKAF